MNIKRIIKSWFKKSIKETEAEVGDLTTQVISAEDANALNKLCGRMRNEPFVDEQNEFLYYCKEDRNYIKSETYLIVEYYRFGLSDRNTYKLDNKTLKWVNIHVHEHFNPIWDNPWCMAAFRQATCNRDFSVQIAREKNLTDIEYIWHFRLNWSKIPNMIWLYAKHDNKYYDTEPIYIRSVDITKNSAEDVLKQLAVEFIDNCSYNRPDSGLLIELAKEYLQWQKYLKELIEERKIDKKQLQEHDERLYGKYDIEEILTRFKKEQGDYN